MGLSSARPIDVQTSSLVVDLLLTMHVFLQGFVSYQLPGEGLSWSSTFREIESNKERLGIVDYSVSQTTLDQVRKPSLYTLDYQN